MSRSIGAGDIHMGRNRIVTLGLVVFAGGAGCGLSDPSPPTVMEQHAVTDAAAAGLSEKWTFENKFENAKRQQRRFVVDRADDSSDGACGAESGRCNLRAAVAAATASGRAAQIELAVDSIISTGE